MLLEDILDAVREDMANDNANRLIAECEFEEDLMYLNDPRAFGPDRDEEDLIPYNWER